MQPAGLDVRLADLDRTVDDRTQLDGASVQFDLPPRDPRHVQQVVDQPGLHFHVAADHFQGFTHGWVEVRSVLEHRQAHHHRRQGRAQFVAQDRQEMVLGAIGLLGGGLRLFGGVLRRFQLLLRPLAVGDVAAIEVHIAAVHDGHKHEREDPAATFQVHLAGFPTLQRFPDKAGERFGGGVANFTVPLATEDGAGFVGVQDVARAVDAQHRIRVLIEEVGDASQRLDGAAVSP